MALKCIGFHQRFDLIEKKERNEEGTRVQAYLFSSKTLTIMEYLKRIEKEIKRQKKKEIQEKIVQCVND